MLSSGAGFSRSVCMRIVGRIMGVDPGAKDDPSRPRKCRRQHESRDRASQTRLKKEIRDVQRLLQRPLKANVREDKERALLALEHELQLVSKSNKDHKMAKRYQMVRFFERQKATRRLRQAEKLWKEHQSAENQEQVTRYTIDLYYTTHFPLAEKYIALYPKSPINNQEVLDKRERIRNLLRDEMLHGKKEISGSNNIQLGKRRPTHQMRIGNNESEDGPLVESTGHEKGLVDSASEEDEFLQIGPRKH